MIRRIINVYGLRGRAVGSKTKLSVANVLIKVMNQSSLEQRSIHLIHGIIERNWPIIVKRSGTSLLVLNQHDHLRYHPARRSCTFPFSIDKP